MPMTQTHYFVVGDKFGEFAAGKNVLTLSQLSALSALPPSILGPRKTLLLGQGCCIDEVLAVLKDAECDEDFDGRFEVRDLATVQDRAEKSLSHKRELYNTLIGSPERVSEEEYRLRLNIDERCELMGDHQTGQHVQGMIIVEAFRQAFLAVSEAHFPFGDGKNYFVINEMNMTFKNFLFPLPVSIGYHVLDLDQNDRRAKHRVRIVAWQNGVDCACAEVSFTIYGAQVISEKEADLAQSVTDQMLSLHAETMAPAVAMA